MDAGDISGRRRCFAVVDRDLTGPKSVGIGAVIAVFRQRFSKSPISKFSETKANCLILLPGSCSCLAEFHFYLFNCNFFPVSVEISAGLEKIAENRDLGAVSGRRGSWAAGNDNFAPLEADGPKLGADRLLNGSFLLEDPWEVYEDMNELNFQRWSSLRFGTAHKSAATRHPT
ncbi:hypothetical protein CRG98_031475 [Punica granatum]|uniref:Uncharacterized protein n=1 Tax=Punica granatum TaxID=22663 RepID=A0A2I0IWI8_PUNGR|nr:hypothetical protein CRG98_031475 [Punica granatum]